MTPEERATAVREALEALARDQICGTSDYPQAEGIIAAAIREAVTAEREACAELADDWELEAGAMNHQWEQRFARRLAAAIRARGTLPT